MNKQFNIYIVGQEKLHQRLKALRGFTRSQRMQRVLVSAMNTMTALARKDVPKKSRLLQSTIYAELVDFGTDNPRIRIGTKGSKYGRWVEEGSSAHVIRPRNKQWLRWTTQGKKGTRVPTPPGVKGPAGLTQIFRQEVNHPGSKAQPFIVPQIHKIRPHLVKAIEKALTAEMGQ